MPDLGLFPLRLVVFPGERLPLHIFEPRYRELVGACIDDDDEFGILLADEDGLRRIGTRVAVVEVIDRFEDGRLNIVLEGRSRFSLVALTSGRAFQTAEVDPVEDELDAADATLRERALHLLSALADAAGVAVELPDPDSPQLSFAIAARVELELEDEQALLELQSERERLHRLAELLAEAAVQARVVRETATKAKTNGHLPHTPELP